LDAKDEIGALIADLQSRLFDLGAALSLPRSGRDLASARTRVEEAIGRYNATLPPLREFVLPGGTSAGAAMHVARTAARRAERVVWLLLETPQGASRPSIPHAT